MREPRPSFTPTTAPEPLASWARGAGLAALHTPMGGSGNGLTCTPDAHFVRHAPHTGPQRFAKRPFRQSNHVSQSCVLKQAQY